MFHFTHLLIYLPSVDLHFIANLRLIFYCHQLGSLISIASEKTSRILWKLGVKLRGGQVIQYTSVKRGTKLMFRRARMLWWSFGSVSECSFTFVMIVCGGGWYCILLVLNVRYNGITNVTRKFTTKKCRYANQNFTVYSAVILIYIFEVELKLPH